MRFLMIAAVLMLSGCVTITGNRTFEGIYDQLQKGTTTRQQALDLLGNPTQVLHPDDKHTVLVYERRRIHGYFLKQVDTLRLSVFIDENDVVADYKTDSMTDDYIPEGGGGGGGVYNTYQPSQPNYSNSFNPGYH